ncbi:MAG: hypothetical protein ABL856_11285 [Gallionella sp.]
MPDSLRFALKFTSYLLLVLSLSLLQACTSVTQTKAPAPSSAPSVQPTAVPVLLSVPAAHVQRKEGAQQAATKPAETAAPDVQSHWLFDSAKDGSLPPGSILPPGIFKTMRAQVAAVPASRAMDSVAGAELALLSLSNTNVERQTLGRVQAAPALKVTLYSSPTTFAHFAVLGVDYQLSLSVWQEFMARHGIEYEVVKDIDVLRYHRPAGVLILPSAVALNAEERDALADYRKRGGSVLATWLSGVRGALGEWTGFDFMAGNLNTAVVGDTSDDEDDVYLIPYGDSPVTHHLAAGLRVWTPRAVGWYPLRLAGVNSAAAIMDWSRSVHAEKANSVISYNERMQANGLSSRVVVLGYPERTWFAADPVAMDAIALDALTWLERRPAAYLGTWPAHHRSAMVIALDESTQWGDTEYRYADLAESLSGHVSYYVLSQQVTDIKSQMQILLARGHELGCMGDSFDGFGGQSTRVQKKRVKQMMGEMDAAGFSIACKGFHAPMESYDPTTIKMLQENGFRYLIGDSSSSESRLPSYAGDAVTAGLLILPRTQNGPDDVLGEGLDFKDFLAELSLSERMGGLNVLRIPGDSMMDDKQWAQFGAKLKQFGKSMWVASGIEVVDWWQERARVSVSLDSSVTPAMLTVVVEGAQPLQQPITVMVNLPRPNASMRLLQDDTEQSYPVVVRRDVWRTDIELNQLAPGTHHWFLQFGSVAK